MEIESSGGIIYQVNNGKILDYYHNVIYEAFIACKGDIKLIEEIFSFRQIEDTNYYINGVGNVIEFYGESKEQWRFLKQNSRGQKDYLRIKFYKRKLKIDGVFRKQINVHNALARCFLYKTKKEDNQVNHINKKRTDNKVWNLEWCDSKENNQHKTQLYNEIEKNKCSNKILCNFFNKDIFIRETEFKGDIKKLFIDKKFCCIFPGLSKDKFQYVFLGKEIKKIFKEYDEKIFLA